MVRCKCDGGKSCGRDYPKHRPHRRGAGRHDKGSGCEGSATSSNNPRCGPCSRTTSGRPRLLLSTGLCQKCDVNVGASIAGLSQDGEAFVEQQRQGVEASGTFSPHGGGANAIGSYQGGVASDSVQGTALVCHPSRVAIQKRLSEIGDEKRHLQRRLEALRGEESEILAVMEDGAQRSHFSPQAKREATTTAEGVGIQVSRQESPTTSPMR